MFELMDSHGEEAVIKVIGVGGGGGSGGCSSRGDASSTKQQPAFSKSELEDLVSKFASEMRVGL